MRRALRILTLALVAVLVTVSSLQAQTTLTSTTLAAAVTNTATRVTLTSGTGFAARDLLYTDGEVMLIQSFQGTSTTIANVVRGREGTQAVAHLSGAPVWSLAGSTTTGSSRAYANRVHGACTLTAERYMPHIVLPGGELSECVDGEWFRYRDEAGIKIGPIGQVAAVTTYTSSGAIAIKPGVILLGCTGACAMTLANPSVEQNGVRMIIIASTAQAHTVTYTAGFDGGTTARDIGTYSGAIGDYMEIIAVNGVWYRLGIGVGAFGGVTLG